MRSFLWVLANFILTTLIVGVIGGCFGIVFFRYVNEPNPSTDFICGAILFVIVSWVLGTFRDVGRSLGL